jgi:hypothetical protein
MSGGNRFLAPKGSLRPRDPLSDAQQDGVVKSPPRWGQMGTDTAGKRMGKGVFKNQFAIRKPGNTAG